jgi:hypothetical protein
VGTVFTVGGNCGGTCVPGTVQCDGLQPQLCDDTGTWQSNGDACEVQQTCVGGVCQGVNCSTYNPPVCDGTATCDLHSNTCCVTPALPKPTGVCVAGDDASCAAGASPFHCQYACECAAGDSCCGVLNTTTYAGAATCQNVPSGGSCTAAAGEATAQLCKQDAECKNGLPCIAQTCVFGSMFQFCGVQMQAPYRCSANDAGTD